MTTSAPDVVLVVDDDELALEIEIEILAAAGYRAMGATTVADALETVRGTRPSLVLLDLHLGVEDGLAVVRSLRGDPATRGIPVVASSSSTTDADVRRAVEAGCDAFLPKPLRPRSLLEGVAAGLRGRRSGGGRGSSSGSPPGGRG